MIDASLTPVMRRDEAKARQSDKKKTRQAMLAQQHTHKRAAAVGTFTIIRVIQDTAARWRKAQPKRRSRKGCARRRSREGEQGGASHGAMARLARALDTRNDTRGCAALAAATLRQ